MNRNTIHSNLHKLVDVDENGNPIRVRSEYLPAVGGLPELEGNAGKYLSTDGTNVQWEQLVIPEVENANWAETDPDSPAFIENKPTLGTAAATDATDYATAAQGALADTAVQSADVGTMAAQDADDVAITGGTIQGITLDDVNSLVGADHIHFKVKAVGAIAKGQPIKVIGFNAGEVALEVGLLTAATDISVGVAHDTLATGQFGAIVHKGVLRSIDTSDFPVGTILYPKTDGTGEFTSIKPTEGKFQAIAYVLRSHQNNGVILIDAAEPKDVLNDVALSGNYNELSNLPTLGSAASREATDFATAAQGATAETALQSADVASVAISGDYNDLDNRPSLAVVATSGQYADLTGQPSALSEFSNDTNFVTIDQLPDPLPDQTGNAGKVLSTDGTTASWIKKCNAVLKVDGSRPVGYVGKIDQIIKLEYSGDTVTRHKYLTEDLETDWPNRSTFTYTPCNDNTE